VSGQLEKIKLKLIEDLLLSQVCYSILARCTAKVQAQVFVFDQKQNCGAQCGIILSRNRQAAVLDYLGHLGAWVRRGDNWASACEHRAQPGRHHQIGCTGSLRKQVDVGRVQQVIEPLEGLQR